MEHPVSGLSDQRDILLEKTKTALVHGGISLRLSEGDESPVLEAHPGSPVDLSGRRPSLTTSMAAQRLYHGSEEEFSRFRRLPKVMGENEEAIRKDGVAAKARYCNGHRFDTDTDTFCSPPKRRTQGLQPFYIPAKVPEQDEFVQTPLDSPAESKDSVDVSLDSTAMDFEFEEGNGVWISATPIAHESRASLATTATATSTLVDSGRSIQGTLTVDTSVASSAASTMSSVDSIQSATTNTSDVYGWEEELERKSSVESPNPWGRRLSNGGRTLDPRVGRSMHDFSHKQSYGKRKGLLYRVLSLSSSRERRESAEDISVTEQ